MSNQSPTPKADAVGRMPAGRSAKLPPDWIEIAERLSSPFGHQAFECGGHWIDARISTLEMRLMIVVYIDGYINSKWFVAEKDPARLPELARRFWHLRSSYLWPGVRKQLVGKSKRAAQRMRREYRDVGLDLDARWYQCIPHFRSPAAFCRQMRREGARPVTLEQYEAGVRLIRERRNAEKDRMAAFITPTEPEELL